MGEIVHTRSGAVRGVSANGVTSFRGIPYAAPLHGPLRYLAPSPAPSWDGVRDARSFGASVPQPERPQAPRAGTDPECLTVNVWTPRPGAADLPVMVWLHGGGFVGGSATSPDFDGTVLARAGVVLVSMNYRVGYPGFGWVADAPANRGVLDQLTALRWVRDNIAEFCGNPDRVTVFGQSAGATSIVALVASGAADGLFHRAIAQSPGNVFLPTDEARAVSRMITDELGIEPTADALAGVAPEAIHAAQWNPVVVMSADPGAWTHPHSPYAVALDGELLDEQPWAEMRRTGAGRSIELICGAMADEARVFTVGADPAAVDPLRSARSMGLDAAAVRDYRRARPGISDAELSTVLASDGMFRLPAHWCAQAHAGIGGHTYLYEFAWSADPVLGACHGLDVPFVFGVPDGPVAADLFGPVVPDGFDTLSSAIREAWVAFAVTGDPGWPRYQPRDGLARIWQLPPVVRADPMAATAAIWDRATDDR
ncbi:para-nitrobenzyl esterase [Tamaricihabitans halophyticus]|uniref:Para-nitrobenzyl esterase n=1 Tax=Tamaricihabitans halophyticus TaxID=1262583 RepID=A0A4R2Q4R0_9PSEU|nr:carboxylesterase family protein [Tamaricihabitans halophyticus]TCP43610.1 para-nitrobenzyl esterase [Tamaricihabitans halophyticus]